MSFSGLRDWAKHLREVVGANDAPAPDALPAFGRYEVLESIGSGATGAVYRARDRQLGRLVALKVLHPGAQIHEAVRQRVRREAQAVAMLSHPNIIALYDAGDEGGRTYLSLELVEGLALDLLLRRRDLPRPRLLGLLEQAARGIHHAHGRGVVHRDLKPANILVTDQGQVKVGDFGLAFLLESDEQLTRTGAALGTPAYMSPEQAAGRRGEIGPRTDVYALGAILYEILTGERPHQGSTSLEIFQRILDDDPVPPRRIDPGISADLETVALKALQKAPENRYRTAEAFADDLKRAIEGQPIEAHPVSLLTRIWRRALRRRAIVLPSAAALLLGALLVGGLLRQASVRAARIRTLLADGERDERSGNPDAARQAYRSALELDPRDAAAAAGLRRAGEALSSGRRESASRLEDVRLAIEKAVKAQYRADSDYEAALRGVAEARRRVETAAGIRPDDATVPYLLGMAWELEGWDDKAEERFRKALEIDPKFGAAHYRLGRVLMLLALRDLIEFFGTSVKARELREPRVREAAGHLEQAMALGIGADEAGFRRHLVGALIAVTRQDGAALWKASKEGIEAAAGAEGVEEFHLLEAIALNGPDRMRALDRAIALRPRFALALAFRGIEHMSVNEPRAAEEDLRAAIRVNPRLAAARVPLGVLLIQRGDEREGIQELTRAVEIDPAFTSAYLNRGVGRARINDLEGAERDLTKAIELDASNGATFYNRGKVRLDRGDAAGAIADCSEAIRLEGPTPGALVIRGDAYRRRGTLEAALRDYVKALEIAPPGWHGLEDARSAAEQVREELKKAVH